jgi:hypothetical protein
VLPEGHVLRCWTSLAAHLDKPTQGWLRGSTPRVLRAANGSLNRIRITVALRGVCRGLREPCPGLAACGRVLHLWKLIVRRLQSLPEGMVSLDTWSSTCRGAGPDSFRRQQKHCETAHTAGQT